MIGRRPHHGPAEGHESSDLLPALVGRQALELLRSVAGFLHRIGKLQERGHEQTSEPSYHPGGVRRIRAWNASAGRVYLATMHAGHEIIRSLVSRRTFLAAGGLSVAGLGMATSPSRPRARSTILIWLSGGGAPHEPRENKPG